MVWYGMVWYGMVWYGMVRKDDSPKMKQSNLQRSAVSGPLWLTDFCLFPCQGLVASGKGSRAGGRGLRGMCACE